LFFRDKARLHEGEEKNVSFESVELGEETPRHVSAKASSNGVIVEVGSGAIGPCHFSTNPTLRPLSTEQRTKGMTRQTGTNGSR
jgi:hypothetical protein